MEKIHLAANPETLSDNNIIDFHRSDLQQMNANYCINIKADTFRRSYVETEMVFRLFLWILSFVVLVIAQKSYIELFEDVNYDGEKYVINESEEDILEFDNKASSFKVFQTS